MIKKLSLALVFSLLMNVTFASEDPIGLLLISGSMPNQTTVNQKYTATYQFINNLPFKMPTALMITRSNPKEMSLIDNCSGLRLDPGQTCTVSVTFSPITPGIKVYSLIATYGNNSVPFYIIKTTSISSLKSVNHIIVIMQENHSFDNYFGALPYVTNGAYHPPAPGTRCNVNDHRCVDGLTCQKDFAGNLNCSNFNFFPNTGSSCNNPILSTNPKISFHNLDYCVAPDMAHEWQFSHQEANLLDPNDSLHGLMNGFVNVNQFCGTPNVDKYETIGYYTETDLAYYYALAQTYATSDRQFSSAVGPTLLNRLYLYAGTSFGHITTMEEDPPPPGYQPINGTVFDLLDNANVDWRNYYHLTSWVGQVRLPTTGPHFSQIGDPTDTTPGTFYGDAYTGNLPPVVFIDTDLVGYSEHPPYDIHSGQHQVATLIDAIRSGPDWKDSVVILTYDEHGGYYDHVAPPPAIEPDNILPGACADKLHPSGVLPANCAEVRCCISLAENQGMMAFITYPGEPLASFNQYGVRVPFMVISPFSKPSYVSHIDRDHTSILAFIEKRFLNNQHLTARDATADPLTDLFDFPNMPSINFYISPDLAPDAPINCQ